VSTFSWLAFPGVIPLYGIATVLYAFVFFGDRRSWGRWASTSLAAAGLIHVIGLMAFGFARGDAPPVSPGESLVTLANATALIYLYVEVRSGARGLGVFACALILVFQISGTVLGPAVEIPEILRGRNFGLHVGFNILAFASFTVGAFTALTYLLQYRQLRSTRPGVLMQRLPSLEALDNMSFRATQVGWVALTVGLVLAAHLAHEVWGQAWQWDPKQCLTLLTWMIYGTALYLRRFRYWQGGRLAALTLTGFATVLAALVIFHGLVETEHQFT